MEASKLDKLYAQRPDIYEKLRKKYVESTARYSILSTDPPIFYASLSLDILGYPSLQPIFDYLQDQVAYFLIQWTWDMENSKDVQPVKSYQEQHLKKYPKHQFIHLCNTLREMEVFQEQGLNAIFCNQNCLIDERIFKINPSAQKSFDAVYDAKISPYKRHYLAQKIDSLAFIYYYDPVKDADYFQSISAQFPNACYFNWELSESQSLTKYKGFPPHIVNHCLNQCRVGLCLSSVEGAMYASIQYLLSGLPVVSTRSQGGRDVFFDDAYTLIVEDHHDAVKEGVDELIGRKLSSDFIRDQVLKKVKHHRAVFIEQVQSIFDREGLDRNFAAEWNQVFFNKLHRVWSPHKAIEILESAKALSSQM